MLHVKSFCFNPIEENTYIVYNEEGSAVIIDPGCYFSEEQDVLHQFIVDNKLQPIQLLNTHCHLDHIFGNKWVHKKYGLELYIHPLEEVLLQHAPQSGIKYGIPFENYNGKLHFLQAGNTIHLNNDSLSILFTPGHSPGSISFYCAEQSFVISGDVLFKGGIGRTDLPGGSFNVLAESIRQQLYTLPNDTVVYSGHGDSTTIGYEKTNNSFVKG